VVVVGDKEIAGAIQRDGSGVVEIRIRRQSTIAAVARRVNAADVLPACDRCDGAIARNLANDVVLFIRDVRGAVERSHSERRMQMRGGRRATVASVGRRIRVAGYAGKGGCSARSELQDASVDG